MWQFSSTLTFVLALSSTGTLAAPCPTGRHVSTRCHDLAAQQPTAAEVSRLVAHRLEARMFGAGGSSGGGSSSGGAGGSEDRGSGGKADKDKPWMTRDGSRDKIRAQRSTHLGTLMRGLATGSSPGPIKGRQHTRAQRSNEVANFVNERRRASLASLSQQYTSAPLRRLATTSVPVATGYTPLPTVRSVEPTPLVTSTDSKANRASRRTQRSRWAHSPNLSQAPQQPPTSQAPPIVGSSSNPFASGATMHSPAPASTSRRPPVPQQQSSAATAVNASAPHPLGFTLLSPNTNSGSPRTLPLFTQRARSSSPADSPSNSQH